MRPESSRNPLTWPPQKRPSSLGEPHIGPCEISVNALSQRKFFRCGTFCADPPFHVHFHAVTRAQSYALHGHNWMAFDQLKTKSAQKMREQNDPLLHREGHADAHPRPRAKGDVGETVDLIAPFAQESRGIEGVRMVPEAPSPVQDIGRNRDHRSSGNMHAREFIIGDRLAGEHRRRGIKAQRLLEDGAKDFALLRRDRLPSPSNA